MTYWTPSKGRCRPIPCPPRRPLELADAIEALAGLVGELRQYAEVKAREEQEEAKARQSGGEGH